MRNAFWVCKLCNGIVWKGLATLRRKKRGRWEDYNGTGTVSAASPLWNRPLLWEYVMVIFLWNNALWKWTHTWWVINLHRLMMGKWRMLLFYFKRKWLVGVSGAKRNRNNGTSQPECENRNEVFALSIQMPTSTGSNERKREQWWPLLMEREWPLIVIHPNKTKI